MMAQSAATRAPAPAATVPGSSRAGLRVRKGLFYAILGLLTVAFVSPLLFMLSTSFKTRVGAGSVVPRWIPNPFTTQAYSEILQTGTGTPVLRWLLNSLIASSLNALLIVATASLAAYALARMDFPGKRVLFALIVGTLFIPPVILMIPNYLIVGDLHWLDNIIAVIVPTAASAFGVFFLRQFFSTLPRELEEAAILDGATPFQTFRKVVLPLSKPALVTLGMLSFLINWNDFLWPVYVLFNPQNQTLPPGLATLQSANTIRYDILMAGAVIASVPVLVLFSFAQRFVIEGVSRTGLKG
jgi:multiple sugar transport system permease protein